MKLRQNGEIDQPQKFHLSKCRKIYDFRVGRKEDLWFWDWYIYDFGVRKKIVDFGLVNLSLLLQLEQGEKGGDHDCCLKSGVVCLTRRVTGTGASWWCRCRFTKVDDGRLLVPVLVGDKFVRNTSKVGWCVWGEGVGLGIQIGIRSMKEENVYFWHST